MSGCGVFYISYRDGVDSRRNPVVFVTGKDQIIFVADSIIIESTVAVVRTFFDGNWSVNRPLRNLIKWG